VAVELRERLSFLNVRELSPPPRLIVNPRAGRKLGISTNVGTIAAVQHALEAAGLHADVEQTREPNHATALARQAARDGCKLVIAAGGDGTVAEAGEGLVETDTALGIMPMGSIMNMARTLCIPRDLMRAAATIADGRVLAMDAGKAGNRLFLEAAGVGLAAGLFGYFNRLDRGNARVTGVLRSTLKFLRGLGNPRLVIVADGERFDVRAPMVTVCNAPYVGAAYALAPDAKVDDGLLDVVIFRGAGVMRILLHLAMVAGGRRLPPAPGGELVRARRVEVATLRRRRLPVHVDGATAGVTPMQFEVLPAALRVIVGQAEAGATCAWGY
jgi:diacylglycerol kinase (ATP)